MLVCRPICATSKMNNDFMFLSVSKDGWAVDLQAEPHLWPGEEAAQPAQGPVADPETDGCKSDEGPGWSQKPAGVQQESGQAGGMD